MITEIVDYPKRNMSDYYIRTPEQNESRGPFDISKLLTLAEAGQINPNTLYYDEEKEEWIPIALNDALRAQVFPEREKLSLKIEPDEAPDPDRRNRSKSQCRGDALRRRGRHRRKA